MESSKEGKSRKRNLKPPREFCWVWFGEKWVEVKILKYHRSLFWGIFADGMVFKFRKDKYHFTFNIRAPKETPPDKKKEKSLGEYGQFHPKNHKEG